MPPRKQTGRRGRPRKNAPPAEEGGFMQWMAKASGAEAHKFMTEKHSKARPPRVADNEYDYEDYVESLKPPPPTQAFKNYMNSYLSGETDPSLLDEPMEEETEVAGFDINEYLNLPESPKEATHSSPTTPPRESVDCLDSGDEVSDQRAGPSKMQEVADPAPGERATAQATQASGATASPSVAGEAMDVDAPAHPATACTKHPASAPQATPDARPSSPLSRSRKTRPVRGQRSRAQIMTQPPQASTSAATKPPIPHQTSPNLSYYREDCLPPVLVDPASASSPAHYRLARAAYSPLTGLSGYETGTSSYGHTMHRSLSSIYDQPLASTSYQATNSTQNQSNPSCLPPSGTYRLSNTSVEVVNSIPSPPSSQTSSTPSPLSHATTPPFSTSIPPSTTSIPPSTTSSAPTYAHHAPSSAPPNPPLSSAPSNPLQPSHSLGPPSHSLLQPSHSLGPLSFARSDDTFMQAVANGTPHLVPDPKPRYVPCLWQHCMGVEGGVDACLTPCEPLGRPASRKRDARPTPGERPARSTPRGRDARPTSREPLACPTPCARDVCPTPCARHACPKWFDRALPREALLVDIYAHFMFFGHNQEQLDAIVMRVYAEVVGA
ncbi:hypothetical protein GGG16DRAFT_114484 [Schizophyllum commune]